MDFIWQFKDSILFAADPTTTVSHENYRRNAKTAGLFPLDYVVLRIARWREEAVILAQPDQGKAAKQKVRNPE